MLYSILGCATVLVCAGASSSPSSVPSAARPSFVFSMTNAVAGNEIVVFERARDGMLQMLDEVPTEGLGTGVGLGSQGALTLADKGRKLLAVNAGSDELTLFAVTTSGLSLLDVVSSNGDRPISVAAYKDLVYVLHAGVPNAVTGFRIEDAQLQPIESSTRALSAAETMPAQVSFDPKGDHVFVTERTTNLIDVFDVDRNGTLSNFRSEPSSGIEPFGFAFAKDRLIVSEAAGGTANASTVSSYALQRGDLSPISVAVPTTETAACWIVLTSNRRFAYSTNTGSDSVSGFSIDREGQLSLLDAGGISGGTGDAPTDAAFSKGSRNLYVLNSMAGTITVFTVDLRSGGLSAIQTIGGLPASGAAGMAVL